MRPLDDTLMPGPLAPFAAHARAALFLCGSLALAACGGAAPPSDYAERPTGGVHEASPPPAASAAPTSEAPSFMRVGNLIPMPAAVAAAPLPLQDKLPGGGGKNDKKPSDGPVKTGTASPSDARGTKSDRDEVFRAGQDSGSGQGQGAVQGAVVDSNGNLSEAEVRATIVQRQSSFRECYDLGLAGASSGFQGTVTLRVSIGPSGAVASVEIVSSTTKNPRVDTCVSGAVHRIQFPAKGSGAVVGFPIEFGG